MSWDPRLLSRAGMAQVTDGLEKAMVFSAVMLYIPRHEMVFFVRWDAMMGSGHLPRSEALPELRDCVHRA